MRSVSTSVLLLMIAGLSPLTWAESESASAPGVEQKLEKPLGESVATTVNPSPSVPATFDECIANGNIANCDSYPDAPKNRARILGDLKSYNECVTSNLAIDCGSLPGAPKKRHHRLILQE